jgi:hypothetical protein
MNVRPVIATCLLVTLGACATPAFHQRPVASIMSPSQSASSMLAELGRIAALSPEQRKRELNELDSARRLDEVKRFQLAALLDREDSAETLERSLKMLALLDSPDSRSQTLIDMMKRSIKSRLELRQQTSRTQELQDKLDQIKELEKSLQQRNTPVKAP